MNYKFFYLYLIGGAIAVGLLIYDLMRTWPKTTISDLILDILPAILLFYLAYKTYHEKNDQELM